jgi:hypothetical protein
MDGEKKREPLGGLKTKPYAPVDQRNLEILVADMGLEPGTWVACADLYAWYAGMCKEDGLEALSQNGFGRAITALGYRAHSRRVDGKLVRSRFMSGRAFPERYVAPGWSDPHTPPGWE